MGTDLPQVIRVARGGGFLRRELHRREWVVGLAEVGGGVGGEIIERGRRIEVGMSNS